MSSTKLLKSMRNRIKALKKVVHGVLSGEERIIAPSDRKV